MATQRLLPAARDGLLSLVQGAPAPDQTVMPVQASVPNQPVNTGFIGGAPYGGQEQPVQGGQLPWYEMKSGGGKFVEQDTPWYKDPNLYNQLALGFNSMRLNPDQGLAQVIGSRIKRAGEMKAATESKNKTVDALRKMGMDEGELALLSENPELLKIAATAMYKQQTGQDITAELQTFNALTAGMSESEIERARRVKLGLEARAGLPLDAFFGRGYAQASGTAAGTAEAAAIQQAEANRILRSQLEFGFDNLGSALGGTGQTGKIFGNLPALTTGAQIADNAKAMLLPVMKGVWRGAGEGVFTDKDQETLEAMFPNRSMSAEAAAQALIAVREMTELKLQNPNFDIQRYGNALRNRGAAMSATPAAAAAPAAPATPNAPAGSNVRSQADAILGR